jgi:hypothetical protein
MAATRAALCPLDSLWMMTFRIGNKRERKEKGKGHKPSLFLQKEERKKEK